jgi:hypothetical protein
VRVAFTGAGAVREASLGSGSAALDLALTSSAHRGQTRTASFVFAASGDLLASQAGGPVAHQADGLYQPTYWAAVSWASVGAWAILLRQSTGIRIQTPAQLELLAVRDARAEQCDFEGGNGSDVGPHRIEWRLVRLAGAAANDAERAGAAFNRDPAVIVLPSSRDPGGTIAASGALLATEGDGNVIAIKPAELGEGLILRAMLGPGPLAVHLGPSLAGRTVARTDAAERDLEDLGPAPDPLILDRARFGAIATLRIR